jgi:hypothetical protein
VQSPGIEVADFLAVRPEHRGGDDGALSDRSSEWAEPFIGFCVKNEVPLDFISTHCYPNDPYKMLGLPEQPR